jgi:cyclic-di-AMP phosphodiesterase PgpH
MLRKYAIILTCSVLLAVMVNLKLPHMPHHYKVGDIARESIRSSSDFIVPYTDMLVKKGEIIVREGGKISSEDLQKLTALRNIARERQPLTEKVFFLIFIFAAIITVVIDYADRNIKKFRLSQKDLIFSLALILVTVFLLKTWVLIFERFASDYPSQLLYIFPIFLFGIIMRITLFSEAVFIFSTILALSATLATEGGISMFAYTFLGNILAAYFSGQVEKRTTMLAAGFFSGLVMAFVMALFHLFQGNPIMDIAMTMGFIVLAGVGSSLLGAGLLPVVEHVFDYTTNFKLLELANLEHPLLQQMMTMAPGTYHHSILVGNLSRAAAESIGAHPILTRVAAYYHDVGKLKMPHYFIENMRGFDDVHKNLSPSMSSLIILSHVKEGVETAERYRLGKKIYEIIQQHHGNSLVSYFYQRAKDIENPEISSADEKDFRYPGPRPQTKEAGIVMLADAVEAASRTLDDPTPKRIENHVQNIIESIFIDGQLDECELTLKDLHAIQRDFITILIGIFHQRIGYPERTDNESAHKKFPRIVEAGQKTDKKGHRRLNNLFKAAG